MSNQGWDLHLKGYTDIDWGRGLDERNSTSGFAFLLNNDVISWSSKKQMCIALSTMEIDLVVLSAAVREGVWFERYLDQWDIAKVLQVQLLVNYDSQAVRAYTKDPLQDQTYKHEVWYYEKHDYTKRCEHIVHIYAKNDSKSYDEVDS